MIHNVQLIEVAKKLNINYSSVRTIASVYRKSGGRTSKLLSHVSKKLLNGKRKYITISEEPANGNKRVKHIG